MQRSISVKKFCGTGICYLKSAFGNSGFVCSDRQSSVQQIRFFRYHKETGVDENENCDCGYGVCWVVNGCFVSTADGYDRTQLQRTMQYGFEPSAFDRHTQLLPNGFYLSYDATTGELWSRKSWEE